jgi:hypothetical protein
VGTGEITLAAKSFRVLLLALTVVTKTANRGRGKFGSSRSVGVLQRGLGIGCGFGTTVLGESTTLANGLSSEGISGDRARRLLDWLLRGKRVGGDLSASGAVRKRSSLKIHIECVRSGR